MKKTKSKKRKSPTIRPDTTASSRRLVVRQPQLDVSTINETRALRKKDIDCTYLLDLVFLREDLE